MFRTHLECHIDSHEEISSHAECGTLKSSIICICLIVIPNYHRISYSYHGDEWLIFTNVHLLPALNE